MVKVLLYSSNHFFSTQLEDRNWYENRYIKCTKCFEKKSYFKYIFFYILAKISEKKNYYNFGTTVIGEYQNNFDKIGSN